MDIEKERQLHALIERAVDLGPTERQAFLQEACGDDSELLTEARAALTERGLDEFLEAPQWLEMPTIDSGQGEAEAETVALLPPSGKAPRRPQTIGPYRLLDKLGEGGMGEVYLAEQERPLRRRVAVKLMRASLVSHDLRARFEAERQALARLAHPNVGAIYDAGTTADGTPFFAMELVEGEPLHRYCDRTQLDLRQRLALMAEACRGVEHAHRKQILHRDLKPSNILVVDMDGHPVPKIIDFGIAKALDSPLADTNVVTHAGFVGTPSYMSPEALVGSEDLDTRTDIYSLGVVLYELLAGVRPFELDREGVGKLLVRIRDAEAPRPSTRWMTLDAETRTRAAIRRATSSREVYRHLSPELDWIILKAIAKERDDRYGSATELATDIDRYLHHRPLLAGPKSWRYQLRKFVRRNRLAVSLITLIAASLVVGVVSTSVALLSARSAEARAIAEAERANQAQDESEEVVKFLTRIFSGASPEAREARSWEETTARDLLETGAAQVEDELADRPLIQARLYTTIAQVYKHNGLYEQAEDFFTRALETRRSVLPEDHPAVASSDFELGQLQYRRGKLKEAEERYQRVRSVYEELGEDHALKRADVLEGLGRIRYREGKFDEAAAFLERVVDVREGLLATDAPDLASTLHNLAIVYRRLARHAEAEALYERTLAIRRKTLPRNHPQVVQTLNNLAVTRADLGRLDEAGPLFEEVLALRRDLLGDEHPAVAESLNNLGVHYRDIGRFQEVEALHREALAIREKVFGPDHPLVAWSLENLAVQLAHDGRFQDAETLQQRALAIREKAFGGEHPDVARSLSKLGELREAEERWREAVDFHERSLAILRAAHDEGHPSLGHGAVRLGTALVRSGRPEPGRARLQEGLAILREAYATDDVRLRRAQEEVSSLMPASRE